MGTFRSRLVALVTALVLLGAAGVPAVEQVGRTRAAIVLPYTDPAGSVILVPGGTTLLTIYPDGSSNSDNFVMRIRTGLLSAGFAIAYVEDPGDLRAIIARMRTVKRPVFLLATSNGTAVAVKNTVALGADGPDGLVLTSTVTKTSKRFTYNAASVDIGKITVPVLFVHNTNDGCSVAPPSGIAPLMGRFPNASDVTRIDVTSAPTSNDPCGPLAPHGYFGIEDDVTAKIVAWMRAHLDGHT
jgi:pimeloyl-ACP methyl ester carboxylesterase